jgi:hypothetical protein
VFEHWRADDVNTCKTHLNPGAKDKNSMTYQHNCLMQGKYEVQSGNCFEFVWDDFRFYDEKTAKREIFLKKT